MKKALFGLPVAATLGVLASLGIGVPDANATLLVGNTEGNNVVKFDERTGQYAGELIAPGTGGLIAPDDLTLGPDGNLYGVCEQGGFGNNYGWVFELPPNCNGTCTPSNLHNFGFSDGANPYGPVVFDAGGNLYGTTYRGGYTGSPCGTGGCGVVWEIAGAAESPRQ